MTVIEDLNSLDAIIGEFDESVFFFNVERLLDYETRFHHIKRSDYHRIGLIWEALEEYYTEYLHRMDKALCKKDQYLTHLRELSRNDAKILCHNIYDHYRTRIKDAKYG